MIYCIDPNAEAPILLIDKHIGNDETDGPGILGNIFSRELLYLDTLGKKEIQVWINSEGGSVSDAEQIYGTILKTKTPVDTYNLGMAASSAGCIFLAGRKRKMMDYAKFMMHQVSGGDEKSRQAFELAVNSMLKTRSVLSEGEVKQLMDSTTWLTAQECLDLGICTEIENSQEFNKPRKTPEDGVKAMHKEFRQIVNKLIDTQKPQSMDKVTNKLKLVKGSNEDAVLEAINKIETDAQNSANALDAMTKKCEAAEKHGKDMEDKYNALKKEKDDADAKAKADAEAANVANAEKKAKELVADGVKAGKIVNSATVVASYEKMAKNDYEGTKTIIDALPVSKVSAKVIEPEDILNKDAAKTNEARPSIDIANPDKFAQQMNAKNMVKVNNRFNGANA